MTSPERIADYFDTFAALLHGTQARDAGGREIPVSDAFARISGRARRAHGDGNKPMFIANGGSDGIASTRCSTSRS